MRIVQYHPRALVGDGGVSNSVRRLATAMADAGAEPVIAYEAADGAPPAADGTAWIPVRHLGTAGIRVPVDLDRALDGADLLVLNSAWTSHNVRAGQVARARAVPYVLAHRGAYDPLILQRRRLIKHGWWLAFERRLVVGARAVHVFFPSQVDSVRALGYDGDVLVAPNGVSVPDQPRWDGGSGGYLLYIGRFDPEHKGLDLLLRAIAGLPAADRPPVRLHGPDWRGGKPQVEALVRQLELDAWVTVGPAVYGADKWALLAAATGFVYPSRWEGFGNAPAEAAAMGVPTLVTPYPLGSYLAERGAAFLAKAEPVSLAEGLQAVQGPDARRTGARAAALVSEEFTWPAVARRWLAQATALV